MNNVERGAFFYTKMELHDKTNGTQLKLHQKHPPYDDFFEARVWGKVILRSGYTIWKS